MKLLINLLKAFCIVIGAYLLFFLGLGTIMSIRQGHVSIEYFVYGPSDAMMLPNGWLCILFGVPFVLAFGALYLPPKGRMFATVGGLSLIFGLLFCLVISSRTHHHY